MKTGSRISVVASILRILKVFWIDTHSIYLEAAEIRPAEQNILYKVPEKKWKVSDIFAPYTAPIIKWILYLILTTAYEVLLISLRGNWGLQKP